MRFEIRPEDETKQPYPTAVSEVEWVPDYCWAPTGTEEEILARAKAKQPRGRNFVIAAAGSAIYQYAGYGGGGAAHVNFERPKTRWFADLTTMEELLAVIEALGGEVWIEDNVIGSIDRGD